MGFNSGLKGLTQKLQGFFFYRPTDPKISHPV
jgi:hypothetical protein